MPLNRTTVFTHIDHSPFGYHRPFTPEGTTIEEFDISLVVNIKAIKSLASDHCRNRFKMCDNVTVASNDGKGFRHEECCIEPSLGQPEPFDTPLIEADDFQVLSLQTAGCDHRRRTIDSSYMDSGPSQKLPMR